MLIIIETGVQYNEVNENIINFHKEQNHTFAWIDELEKEHVFTQKEVDEAYSRIRGYFLAKDADPLMAKYLSEEITKEEWQAKRQKIKDAWQPPQLNR